MNDVTKNRLKKLGRFLIFKLPIILIVLGVVMIVTLKLLERYPNPLRQGFEDLLSMNYQANATIGVLEKVTFFPNLDVSAKNITMHNKANAAMIDMSIESFKISTPFWSVFFNAGRLNDFQIKNLIAVSGVILPHELDIEELKIVNKNGPDQYGSFITAKGKYKNQDMRLEVEIEKRAKGYKILKEFAFSLRARGAELNGELRKGLKNVTLKDAVLNLEGKNSVATNYVVFEDEKFLDGNPLYCLLHADEIENCKIYTNESVNK